MKEELFQISHEIKNSLAVMKGYMSLFDGNIEKYQKYMPLLEKSIDHSIELLTDFKDIGNLTLDFDIIDINYLLEEIIDIYKPIMLDKGIKLISNNLDEELFIEGDYKRLKQVFVNILKNSVDAIEGECGNITIETNSINGNVIIIFKDNGCGMDEYTLSNIFKPFYTTKKYGTGLGMYISKDIIDKHNGSIKYISNQNGTSVKIKLNQYMI